MPGSGPALLPSSSQVARQRIPLPGTLFLLLSLTPELGIETIICTTILFGLHNNSRKDAIIDPFYRLKSNNIVTSITTVMVNISVVTLCQALCLSHISVHLILATAL